MTFFLARLTLGLLLFAATSTYALSAARAQDREILTSSNTIDRRSNMLFDTARGMELVMDADLQWDKKQRTARFTRGDRSILFRQGDPIALANGQRIHLPVVPYLKNSMLMIPSRITATALAVPISWDKHTDSLLIGPIPGSLSANKLRALPVETSHTGFVIYTPQAGDTCNRSIRIHGQASLYEGELVVQLQTADGQILQEGTVLAHGTREHHCFDDFIVSLGRAESPGSTISAQIVAFIRTKKEARGSESATAQQSPLSIPITFRTSP